MHEDRAVVVFVLFEEVDERVEVVTVVGTEVFEAQLFEKSAGNDHVLEELLHVVREFVQLAADDRNSIHDALREILR